MLTMNQRKSDISSGLGWPVDSVCNLPRRGFYGQSNFLIDGICFLSAEHPTCTLRTSDSV